MSTFRRASPIASSFTNRSPKKQGLTLEAATTAGYPRVTGNRELIGQAIGNLIDNAIKYAEGGEQSADQSRQPCEAGWRRS